MLAVVVVGTRVHKIAFSHVFTIYSPFSLGATPTLVHVANAKRSLLLQATHPAGFNRYLALSLALGLPNRSRYLPLVRCLERVYGASASLSASVFETLYT